MARGKKRPITSGAVIPLSSSDGRDKPAPPLEITPPPTPSEALLDLLGVEKDTDRRRQHYDEARVSAVLSEMGVVHAEMTYHGGYDEGSMESLYVHFEDGDEEDWSEFEGGVRPAEPERELRWHLTEALWGPAEAQWGSFATENFSMDGTVTWTLDEGIVHNYTQTWADDHCERCDEDYEHDTVSFHEVPNKGTGFSDYICDNCFAKLEAGDPELVADYGDEEDEAEEPEHEGEEQCVNCAERYGPDGFADRLRCKKCQEEQLEEGEFEPELEA